MVDLGKVVASLELETAGFTGGIDAAIRAAQALRNLEGVGRDAVNGLIAGAAARRSALVSSFKALARAAIEAARQELGIASPSKVFMEIGKNTAKGFQIGVDGGAEGARASMRRLTAAGALSSATWSAAPPRAEGPVTNYYGAPITVTFPGAVVRSDADILELERRTQKVARDLMYGLGAR